MTQRKDIENKKAADNEQQKFLIETKPITIWKIEHGVLKEISIEGSIWVRKQPTDSKGRFIKDMVE